jgi:ABC-type multidrug transport system ATPase subunit
MLIKNLSFSYNGHVIFDHFSFSPSSSLVCFKGPPGSGKTTLLKLIAGHLQPEAVERFDVQGPVGMIVQEPTLLPWLDGTDNITKLACVSEDSLQSHPLFPLISDFTGRRACQMSYGQQRLVELVRILILSPAILCLDEPLNFLDERSKATILGFIQHSTRMHSQVFVATHSWDELRGDNVEEFSFNGMFPVQALEARP